MASVWILRVLRESEILENQGFDVDILGIDYEEKV